jgi:class 3 adenylate cyclase
VLAEGARRVGAGESQLHIDAGSNDELGELAESFNQMLASVRSQTKLVEQKNRENEDLLLNVLPKPIAKRLKAGEENIADSFDNVTVLFSDLVGFTDLLRTLPPHDSVSLLNEIVSSFDEAAERRVVEKIKTIGDGYMAASGLVTSQLDHAKRAIDLALDMMGIVRRVNNEHGLKLELRIGINSGPIVAGVIGRNKFLYDLWGRTVNAASNLKSAALPGEVLMTASVAESVKGLYPLEPVERDGVPGFSLAGDAGSGRPA